MSSLYTRGTRQFLGVMDVVEGGAVLWEVELQLFIYLQ